MTSLGVFIELLVSTLNFFFSEILHASSMFLISGKKLQLTVYKFNRDTGETISNVAKIYDTTKRKGLHTESIHETLLNGN